LAGEELIFFITARMGPSFGFVTTSCSAVKAEGRRRKRSSELWCLSSQIAVMCNGALLSWRRP